MSGEPAAERRTEPSVDEFFLGVNLPWLNYGCDFGANAWQPEGGVGQAERRSRLDEIFARLGGSGLHVVRWFVLCDGRCGLEVDSRNVPPGVDRFFARDFEAGLRAASKFGLSLIPVLFDFLWFSRGRRVNGVMIGGRRALLASPRRRQALLDRVVTPLLRAYGRESVIRRWDLFNEPEWATLGYGGVNPMVAVRPGIMRAVLKDLASAAKSEARQGVTVGLASPRGMPLVKDVALDELQVHWYDRRAAQLYPPPSSGLPVFLGEFPTRGSAISARQLLAAARAQGYRGALGWSAAADDRHTELTALEQAAG